jgi:hypothetical protein
MKIQKKTLTKIVIGAVLFIIITTVAFYAFSQQRPYSGSEFLEDLKEQGASVNIIENGSSAKLFYLNGTFVNVSNHRVEYFEYPTLKHADYVISTISPDGHKVRGALIYWKAPPHFFRKNNLMVLYSGTDNETLQYLENVLGKQFAGE